MKYFDCNPQELTLEKDSMSSMFFHVGNHTHNPAHKHLLVYGRGFKRENQNGVRH